MSSKKSYTEENKNNRSRQKLALVVLLIAVFLLCFYAVKQFGIRGSNTADNGNTGVQSGQVESTRTEEGSGPVDAGPAAPDDFMDIAGDVDDEMPLG